MSYEIHIQRKDRSKIQLEEWLAAVNAREDLRPASGDAVAVNPITGDTVRIPGKEGDAEFYDAEKETWLPCFRYSSRRISFKPTADFDDLQSSFRRMVAELAAELGAQVVGDEGEVYD